MGRSERAVDRGEGPVAAFAADLRDLREVSGRPTYRAMGRKVARSTTSLSEAAGGQKFPTLETTLAYVEACDGDVGEWTRRWQQANDRRSAPPEREPAPTGGRRRPTARRRHLAIGVPVVIVVAAAVAVVSVHLASGGSPRPAAAPVQNNSAMMPPVAAAVRDGADPKDSGCSSDPRVVTLDQHGVQVGDDAVLGVAELRYSPACGVSWGRFTPGSVKQVVDRPGPLRVHVGVGRDGDHRFEPFDMPYDGFAVYGNVLHSVTDCVYAEVYFSGPGWTSPPARTACYRGTTGVHP